MEKYTSADKRNDDNDHNKDQSGSPKNRRKYNSKKFDDMEETTYAQIRKPDEDYEVKGNKRGPKCCKNTNYYFSDFCNSTSIHGFKLLGEQGRYFIEKLWWLFVITVAFGASSYFIYKTYQRWMASPIVVTYTMTETPIWKIPFPAVTICPEVKVDRTVFNYTDVYLKYVNEQETSEEEDELYDFFSLICEESLRYIKENESDIISDEALDAFLKSLHRLEAEYCRWLGVEYDCDEVLSPTYTSEGLCRTFNMLDFSEIYIGLENDTANSNQIRKWSLEKGYPSNAEFDTFPRRTMLTGAKSGFHLDLFVNSDNLDYLCGELQGFKVTLHDPSEAPDMDKYIRVPLDQAVLISVKPSMIKTADELLAYSPEIRQCYLPGERTLSSFKTYTQQNCLFECLSNYTLRACGCVGFDMPYEDDTKFCGSGKKNCMEQAKVSFLEKEVKSKLNPTEGKTTGQCGCLPSCTSLNFDSETSQNNWDWRKTFSLRPHDPEIDYIFEKDHYSRLTVYYKETQFPTSERHRLYSEVSLLANCGGLLALFCGFSCTSVMEILYFLTLRFLCNLIKYGRRAWSGSPQLLEKKNHGKDHSIPE